ncbi:hypothetical protein D3C78_1046500 [compost metagenome]
MGLDVGLEPAAALRPIRDIELDQPPLSSRRHYGGQGRLGAGAVAVIVHHYVKAIGGQLQGDGAAYALAGARHQYGGTHIRSFSNRFR